MCKSHYGNLDCFLLINGVYFIIIIKKHCLIEIAPLPRTPLPKWELQISEHQGCHQGGHINNVPPLPPPSTIPQNPERPWASSVFKVFFLIWTSSLKFKHLMDSTTLWLGKQQYLPTTSDCNWNFPHDIAVMS